jgi:hypothetical protein
MTLDELFKDPVRIDPFDHEILDKNRRYAFSILHDRHAKKMSSSFNNADFQLYALGNKLIFIEKDPQTLQVVYFVEFSSRYRLFLGKKCIQQILVWRDRTIRHTQNLATEVFFNVLLGKSGAIITDYQQSPDGEAFWDNRIVDALAKGLHLYFVDIMPPRVIEPILTEKEYKRIKQDREIWGKDPKHGSRRILITTTPVNKPK